MTNKIVPTGDPAWARTSNHTTYGGDLNKKNWQSQGVVDARTDVDAAALCRLAEDLSACSRTCPFGVISWTCVDTPTPGPPWITAAHLMLGTTLRYRGQSGLGQASEDPPAGFPTAARNSNGDVTFTFAPTAVTYDYSTDPPTPHVIELHVDEYGTVAHWAPVQALACARTSGAYATAEIAAQTVRVQLLNTVGNGVANASGTLAVF